MNKVILVGNLARDPELKTTQSGINVCSFTIAVNRKFTNQQGEREADFINCVAWRGTGEFVAKHFSKGKKIGVAGALQVRSYADRDGQKRYATEVLVDDAEFVTPKDSGASAGQFTNDTGMRFTEVDDNDLPF